MISREGYGMNIIIEKRFKYTVCRNFNYCKGWFKLYTKSHRQYFDNQTLMVKILNKNHYFIDLN